MGTPALSLLSYSDIIGVPVILAILFLFMKLLAPKYIVNKSMRRLFYMGIVMRLFAILLGVFYYAYIEKGGDTFIYFDFAKGISKVISTNNFDVYSKLFYLGYEDIPFHIKSSLPTSSLYVDIFSGNPLIIKIAGVISFFLFDSYLAISIVFTIFGYLGLWLIFYRFTSMNPRLKYLFYFFIICWPSTLFFGSGVLKEPICIGCIGLLFYFIFKKAHTVYEFIKYLAVVAIAALILLNIKSYLFYSFFFSFMIAYSIHRINNIHSVNSRRVILSSMGLAFIVASYYLFLNFESIVFSSQIGNVAEHILYSSNAQLGLGSSSYDLGKLEMTFGGIAKYLLASLNVSLFRPYIFEINKFQLLIIGSESFVMLLIVLFTLYAVKFNEILRLIKNNPVLIFSILFVVIVAIQIGAIAFNFGALMRYKIPLLPFFFSTLVCLCSKEKRINKFLNYYFRLPV